MPVALPILLLAAGAAYVLKGMGDDKDEDKRRCDTYPSKWRRESQDRRQSLLETIQGSANIAPKRILFDNGQDVDQGLIQVIWNSDGPWGRIGCEPTEYGMRDLLLVERTLPTKSIVVDVDYMLKGHPWGQDHVDDMLMLERIPDKELPGASHRATEEIVYAMTGTDYTKVQKVPRRSWMEAQVLVGDLFWSTEAYSDKFGGTVYGGVKADFSTAKFPHDQESVWPAIKQIQGPDALVLLRPDNNGNGRAISLWGTHFIDISVLLDPESGDIIFEGKDWFTKDRVLEALSNDQLLATSNNARPGEDLRPIDVLLWLLFREAEKAAGEEEMGGNQLKFLAAIGNTTGWVQLQEENIGWMVFMNRHYSETEEILEYQSTIWG